MSYETEHQMTTIPTHHLSTIRAKVDKVNRRAAKLGVEGLTLQVSEKFRHTFEYATRDRIIRFEADAVDVSVVGPSVKVEGWTFLAAIDHFEGLVRTTPDASEDQSFAEYTKYAVCQHCNIHRDRKTTYILQDEDGLEIQVGSTCLKDFLGHDVNLFVAFQGGEIEDEFEGGFSYDPKTAPLIEVLTLTSAAIRRDGWAPKSKSYPGSATAETVGELLNPASKIHDQYPVTEEDVEVAQAAREWAQSLDARNDYLFNLRSIANNDFITDKSLGLAVSLIAAYRKAVEKEIERKVEQETAAPVPQTTERIVVEGTVVNVTWKESYYGYRTHGEAVKKITVRDDRGFKLWGTCPSKIIQANQGDRVRFTAKIQRGDRDESFGFFSRPTKPELISQAEEVNA